VPSYPFTGVTGRMYTQYIDLSTGHALEAIPGGSYDMQPVPGAGDVPVPPGDGLWGPQKRASPKPPPPADDADSAAKPPSATPDTTTPAAAPAKEG
jgi:hypothetical protein